MHKGITSLIICGFNLIVFMHIKQINLNLSLLKSSGQRRGHLYKLTFQGNCASICKINVRQCHLTLIWKY